MAKIIRDIDFEQWIDEMPEPTPEEQEDYENWLEEQDDKQKRRHKAADFDLEMLAIKREGKHHERQAANPADGSSGTSAPPEA